jgi:hypothetical protein
MHQNVDAQGDPQQKIGKLATGGVLIHAGFGCEAARGGFQVRKNRRGGVAGFTGRKGGAGLH